MYKPLRSKGPTLSKSLPAPLRITAKRRIREIMFSLPKKSEEMDSLPQLSEDERRRYGNLGALMERYHSYYKEEFIDLYNLADGSFNKQGMSLGMFLQRALQFRQHLNAHHTTEERIVFPHLAKKMPTFRDNERHKASHKGIHDGLNSLVSLVVRFREDQTKYSPTEMRECLDSFRDVLMSHLDEEVHDLRAENMRKYWTLEEIDSFPW